jgi:hypothetical protein
MTAIDWFRISSIHPLRDGSMTRIALLLLAFALTGCSSVGPSVAPAPSPRTAEVVAVANRLFAAMEARDTAAIRRMFLPQARIVSVARQGEGTAVRERSIGEFIPGIAAAPEPLRERMWSPEVRIDGDLAMLWAPYDFHLGARFSHCGTDVFQMVRLGGEWRIAALSYTVQREGCPPAPSR